MCPIGTIAIAIAIGIGTKAKEGGKGCAKPMDIVGPCS